MLAMLHSAASARFTLPVISAHFASGALVTVTKSPSRRRAVTPFIAKSRDAIGCSMPEAALRKLMGQSAITRSKINFIALGLGVGCTSLTLNGTTANLQL